MQDSFINKEDVLKEIDIFEKEIELRKQGKIDEKVFAETRLRRGVYGQRYDNGQRHDGNASQKLDFPSGDIVKGPGTLWDAPGMMRIKIPFGGLTPAQLEVIGELAEEFSDDIAHVTTRQDFQLHYIHIDDTPEIMRRLAEVGITTKEACGNVVRNVTACPIAGVCREEVFDVTPYANALAKFLLGHPDAQDFGRKFKIAFSGCKQNPCGLTTMHDFGAIAAKRIVDGKEERGFELYVGGGLGAVPHTAKLFDEFVPETEILPLAQAISRVFARLGEKKNRARARVKFLVQKLGIDEFRRLVLEERQNLREDPSWTAFLESVAAYQEEALHTAGRLNGHQPEGFSEWLKYNVYRQRQAGYATVTVKLPLGDITAHQSRQLADIARRFIKETMRLTVEQNIVLRWVSERDLPELYLALKDARLAEAGAGTIEDIVTCPGTDTCKLGIASSRGLGAELMNRFANGFLSEESKNGNPDPEIAAVIRELHIKISGCFNSCGQHHVADLGFYGINRKKSGYNVPHFQVVLGGQWSENAGSYGLAMGAVPSKRIPDVVEKIARRYSREKQPAENFQAFIKRIGKAEIKAMLQEFTAIPLYESDRSFYSDWGDPREFTLGDMGVGECAGEVVSKIDFELTASERELFDAQIALEKGDFNDAGATAIKAMLRSARALTEIYLPNLENEPLSIVEGFREHLYKSKIFFDPYAKGKFARYLLSAFENRPADFDQENAHRQIEEAQLFVEAAYSCYARMETTPV